MLFQISLVLALMAGQSAYAYDVGSYAGGLNRMEMQLASGGNYHLNVGGDSNGGAGVMPDQLVWRLRKCGSQTKLGIFAKEGNITGKTIADLSRVYSIGTSILPIARQADLCSDPTVGQVVQYGQVNLGVFNHRTADLNLEFNSGRDIQALQAIYTNIPAECRASAAVLGRPNDRFTLNGNFVNVTIPKIVNSENASAQAWANCKTAFSDRTKQYNVTVTINVKKQKFMNVQPSQAPNSYWYDTAFWTETNISCVQVQ